MRLLLDGVRGDPLEAVIVCALGLGVREGELLALRWQDVDLERGELVVRHTLQRFTRQLAPTKTARSSEHWYSPPASSPPCGCTASGRR